MLRKHYDWTLPEEITSRLGESTYGRQRAIYEGDHLLLILHSPPLKDEDTRVCIVFLRTPDGQWQCNGQENGEFRMRKLLASYDSAFQRYDDLYEEAKSAAELFATLEVVTPLNRASTHLYAALQAARDLVENDIFLIGMRDEAYEFSRNFDLLLADAKLALDCRIAHNAELQAVQAHEMAAAQHKLNILAAITFPLMALATLFGMNLTSGLENLNAILFWIVFAAGISVGLVTQKWVIKTATSSRSASLPKAPSPIKRPK